jgi:hypothetical protein
MLGSSQNLFQMVRYAALRKAERGIRRLLDKRCINLDVLCHWGRGRGLLALQQVKHSGGNWPGHVGLGPLRGSIGLAVGRHAGRKLLWLAHAYRAHLSVASAKLLDERAVHLQVDVLNLLAFWLVPAALGPPSTETTRIRRVRWSQNLTSAYSSTGCSSVP